LEQKLLQPITLLHTAVIICHASVAKKMVAQVSETLASSKLSPSENYVIHTNVISHFFSENILV